MASRKIAQDQKFLYGWDDVTDRPIYSIDHGATWDTIVVGTGGVDADMNGTTIISSANPLNFESDIAGGKVFVEVLDDAGGGVNIEVDKQINYVGLGGGVGPVVTGFTFDGSVYRACELIYTIEKGAPGGTELETGHIMMLHDGTDAGVVVTRRGTEVLPFTQGNPGVTFSADMSGDTCRLLYTEVNGDAMNLSVKPRPIRINS